MLTTVSFFKLENLPNKWWAFKQMQLGHGSLKNTKGLKFYKILGSGSKKGFSAFPNFGTYVLICVWESQEEAKSFFELHPFYLEYKRRSCEEFTVYLKNAESHGLWDGVQPFTKVAELEMNQPVVVLTRARIRFTKLWSFWTRVGKVSQSLDDYEGLIISIGVGEWPLIQQATLSIWRTQAEMMHYAYKNSKHKEVVLLTRKLKWYKEELFARFVPYQFEGLWNGIEAKKLL